MLAHVRPHPVGVAEELDVAQLVDLVRADRPLAEVLEVPGDLLDRGGEEGHARAGPGDLGGRGEHHRAVRVARARGQRDDVGALGLVLGEVVHRVGVVPEDLEVGRRGLHARQPAGHLVADDRTGRVGVGRDDPDALDRPVGAGDAGDLVDVGALVGHRHGDHLDAEVLEEREVAVVAGHRADEGDLVLLGPGARGVDGPEEEQVDEHVAHHRQRGVAAGDDLLGLDPEQLGEDLAQLGQPGEAAVVAHVGAGAVRGGRREGEHRVGEVELCGARLAARHVELGALGGLRGVGLALGLREGVQLLRGEVGQGASVGRRSHAVSLPPHVGSRCGASVTYSDPSVDLDQTLRRARTSGEMVRAGHGRPPPTRPSEGQWLNW